MLKVGITGGIGSGKSIVSKIFETLNVPVYLSDVKGREFLNRTDVIQKVEHAFGNVVSDGQIDRAKLAEIVFHDPEKLKYLNSIIHPLILNDFQAWSSKYISNPYVIMESAILFESGFATMFDYTVHVTCPLEIRIQRVMQRDHTSKEAILSRIKNQWDEDKISSHTSHCIVNDGKSALIPQILKLHSFFSAH